MVKFLEKAKLLFDLWLVVWQIRGVVTLGKRNSQCPFFMHTVSFMILSMLLFSRNINSWLSN